VYDGNGPVQGISGGVHPLDAPFPRQEAITRAYISRYGFLSRPPKATCWGERVENGRRILAVRVQPPGSIPATLLFDARTHLLSGYVERFPIDIHVTTFSDYRNIGGVMLPFRITSATQFEPANADVLTIRRYALNSIAFSTDFTKPQMQNAAVMDAGSRSTTIPMRVEDGETLVWASIDNHAAMPFLLDTGGHAIFTASAAATLKINQVGNDQSGGSKRDGGPALCASRVATYGRRDPATAKFLVIDYPRSFWDRGAGKQPLAGILGLAHSLRDARRASARARRCIVVR
jgi:hypothetical protein